jgi:hypothetical protein
MLMVHLSTGDEEVAGYTIARDIHDRAAQNPLRVLRPRIDTCCPPDLIDGSRLVNVAVQAQKRLIGS